MKNDRSKKKVAWGITGSGDKILEILNLMGKIQEKYSEVVDIKVYLSKSSVTVLKYYKLLNTFKRNFTYNVEIDSNTPFLAGALQLGIFDFFLIAPTTSNTVAKIALGIADTLISNAAIMALKAFIPVYVLPSDCKEGKIITKLPNGRQLKLKIRKEDVDNVKKLEKMKDILILHRPQDISTIFRTQLASFL